MTILLLVFLSALSFMLPGMPGALQAQQQETGPAGRRVIIFVWDGLRADELTPDVAPNYFALARSGVVFADHHAVYPTFTMMNSASIATGAYPGVHGFYGNVVYAPSAKGRNAKGADIDFSAPAFIEDFGVVEAVREAYKGRLTLVSTMLQAAQAKGLTTAVSASSEPPSSRTTIAAGSFSMKMRRCRSVSPRNCNRRGIRFRATAATHTRQAH